MHRDLKPENIIVGDFGEVVVLDWGLAKRLGESEVTTETADSQLAETLENVRQHPPNTSQTMQGDKLGTPAYMSPEQARGEIALIDQRTDIYGLAAILYEILVGQPPFLGKSILEVIEKVVHDKPNAPADCVDGIPRALEEICLRGLSKRRARRQQSAASIGEEIQDWIAQRTERKRTEQERERFFNLSLDLLTILDSTGHLTQSNPAWEAMLGWKPEELLGKSVWELIALGGPYTCREESSTNPCWRIVDGNRIPMSPQERWSLLDSVECEADSRRVFDLPCWSRHHRTEESREDLPRSP